VAEAHGGDIEVESSEGKGSKFSVRLPVKGVAKRDPPELLPLSSPLEEGLDPVNDRAEAR